MKVFLSPSNQKDNRYAYGNTTEHEVCGTIAQLCKEALIRCGIEVMCVHDETMAKKASKADSWGADLYVPIHSNAHNGKTSGTRMFYYKGSTKGKKACEAIYKHLAPLTPGTSENITAKTDLYELRVPNAPTAYIEIDFHDNKEVAKWIVEHKKEIAETIAKGVCDYAGVKYKAPNTASANNDTIYMVYAAAHSVKTNAEKTLSELKAAGFDGYIVPVKKA